MFQGEVVLLFDPPNRLSGISTWKKWHLRWVIFCLMVAVAGLVWFGKVAWETGVIPGGSSMPGLAAGSIAGLLFFYLFSYALRKFIPFRWWYRLRPTKYWLAQHIWLGLLTFPMVAIHSGLLTRWGGILTVALMVVYFGVLFSGIWGLWMQQKTPRLLLQEIPDESNFYHLPEITEQLRKEAELLVLAACGSSSENGLEELSVLNANRDILHAVRKGKGSGILRDIPEEPLPDTQAIRKYFRDVVDPYLRRANGVGGVFRLRSRMKADFNDLRKTVNPGAVSVVDNLETICEYRNQFDEQTQLHGRLHGWIVFHLALSAVLLLLLVCHAVSAVWYW